MIRYFRYDHPRVKEARLLNFKTEFTIVHNHRKVKDAKVKFVLKAVRRIGLWAFCRHITKDKKEIHFWIGKHKKVQNYNIMDMLAHEISHSIGIKSEKIASKFGGVAGLAYMLMQKQLKEYIRK